MNKKISNNAHSKILIVEDERIVAIDLAESLKSLGYEVTGAASTGEQAIRLANETLPNLILMDIRLKGVMDGIDTAKKITAAADIPVIYLTAFADDQTIERAKSTEPFGYILKPFDKKALHTTIEMAIYKHRMEKKLKDNERWLSTTLKSIGDALIAVNASGKIIFMNPVAETYTGWTQSEALNKNISEVLKIIKGENRIILESLVSLVKERGDRINLQGETYLVNKNGIIISILGTASPIMDDQNILNGVVIVFQDVSEQKKIERERERLLTVTKQRVAELDAVLESIPDAVYIGDRSGIKKANKPALQLLGINLPIDTEKGTANFSDLKLSFANNKKFLFTEEEFFAYAMEGKTSTREIRMQNNLTGEESIFRSAAAPIMLEEKIIGAVTINTDITKNKKAEEELRLSEERFAKAFRASPHSFSISRLSDGIIIEVNDSWEKLFEYSREEMNMLKFKTFDFFIDGDAEKKALYQLKEKGMVREFETEIRRKSGENREVSVSIEQIELNGEAHLLLILKDITERKRAEVEREVLFRKVSEAQERLKALSSRLMEIQELERRNLARELHDQIGQMLTAIKINLQMTNQFIGKPAIEEHIKESIELTDEALKQVRSLSLDLRPSMLDDLGLLPALRWYIDRQSQRTGIKAHLIAEPIAKRLSPNLEITCYRITQEAITNVIRYAGVDVTVKVEVWLDKNELNLKISDNGKGFDVYAAVQRALRGKSMGILGMQERVELVGGSLKINSKVGKGTDIHAVFPLD